MRGLTTQLKEIFYEVMSCLGVWYYSMVWFILVVIMQVLLTEFKSLPPLFEDSPNAILELTIASIVLDLEPTNYNFYFFLSVLQLSVVPFSSILHFSCSCVWKREKAIKTCIFKSYFLHLLFFNIFYCNHVFFVICNGDTHIL